MDVSFETLLNKVITKIDIDKTRTELSIYTEDGEEFTMQHYQDCCESVFIEDVIGDLQDLLNSPILLAEEVSSNENPEGIVPEYQESFTWTFYKLSTIKGSVTIRWYGSSNGYYSESVSFQKVK